MLLNVLFLKTRLKRFCDRGTYVKLDKVLNNAEIHPETYHEGKIKLTKKILKSTLSNKQ